MTRSQLVRFSRFILCIFTFVVLSTTREVHAATTAVQIIQDEDAPTLEHFAAQELAGQLRRLFKDVDVQVSAAVNKNANATVFMGCPDTNSAMTNRFPDWPNVSPQGIVIRAASDGTTFAVGGGSPVATLWAVYELGHRLGVRYLPRGDMYPLQKQVFSLAGVDGIQEPQIQSRMWYADGSSPVGPATWGIEEYTRHLRQLAKMKINGVVLSVESWHPYVQYEISGVSKSAEQQTFAALLPVDGETVGKKVFQGRKRFMNPDFRGSETADALHTAGKKHLQSIMKEAHDLGMTVGLSIATHELPAEFKAAFPPEAISSAGDGLSITPSTQMEPGNAVLAAIGRRIVRAYLETYPTVDVVFVRPPRLSDSDKNLEDAAKLYKGQFGFDVSTVALKQTSGASKQVSASGLACVASVFSDSSVLQRSDGSTVGLVIQGVGASAESIIKRAFPDGTQVLHEAATEKAAGAEDSKTSVPKISAVQLENNSAGILPQSTMTSLASASGLLKQQSANGMAVTYLIPGELDASVYLMSQAGWRSEITAEHIVRELWTTSTGNAAAADRLWKAWQHLERATELITKNSPEFAHPVPGMLMQHYSSDPAPDWWQQATDAYTEYMVELYRAQGAIDGDAAPILFDYAKRSEYAVEYLSAVKAVREAGIAKAAGDIDATFKHMETALEQLHNCIGSLADVTRNQSDRGVIAALNAYAYRPLLEEYEKLADAE